MAYPLLVDCEQQIRPCFKHYNITTVSGTAGGGGPPNEASLVKRGTGNAEKVSPSEAAANGEEGPEEQNSDDQKQVIRFYSY